VTLERRTPRNRFSKAKGFSLLEILLTVALLGIALIPLALSFKTSSRSVTSTREYLSAVALAQSALEEIRLARFRPIAPESGNQPAPASAPGLETVDDVATRLNGTTSKDSPESLVEYGLEVDLLPDHAGQDPVGPGKLDLRVIRIIVRWKARGGAFAGDQQYELYSVVGSSLKP